LIIGQFSVFEPFLSKILKTFPLSIEPSGEVNGTGIRKDIFICLSQIFNVMFTGDEHKELKGGLLTEDPRL
jgi:hypothetical protein